MIVTGVRGGRVDDFKIGNWLKLVNGWWFQLFIVNGCEWMMVRAVGRSRGRTFGQFLIEMEVKDRFRFKYRLIDLGKPGGLTPPPFP